MSFTRRYITKALTTSRSHRDYDPDDDGIAILGICLIIVVLSIMLGIYVGVI